MFLFLSIAVFTLSVAYLFNLYRSFRVNLAAAKKSGIPYVVSPVYVFSTFWLVTHPIWLKIINLFPAAWSEPWIKYSLPGHVWTLLYSPFETLESDAFMVVAPSANSLYVADAEAINQITTRRNDFPKPTHIYKSVDVFGKNVVSTEGAIWRQHRKITSPPFTERNNHMVWRESLDQAQRMMAGWMGEHDVRSGPLKDIASQTMRLSLYVISLSGFGMKLNWPHENKDDKIPEGHTLSYKDALSLLLEYIVPVMMTPRWILKYSPLEIHKVSWKCFTEWGQYMREMYQEKRNEVLSGENREGMDLMGALVKGAGITPESLSGANPEKGGTKKQMLSDEEILGNAFVFILAGHETAANTLHYSMIFLAMNWASQKHLQDDLDAILGDKPIDDWSYDDDMPKLFGGMCGAVMNEELRVLPPVVGIPKWTSPGMPQSLSLGGHNVTVPGGTYITLNTVAVHRSPKLWPHASREDLLAFRPERWLNDISKPASTSSDNPTSAADEGPDFDGPDQRRDTAAGHFSPPKGAYIPFSDGYRSCLGRRFAQVEILAVLAVIFKTWSVELDVSAYMSDEELETASEEAKREAWGKAKERAEFLLREGMMTIITIQMRGEKVPMRFVRRGEERLKF